MKLLISIVLMLKGYFMLVGKKLTDYTDLFSPYDFKKNDNIISSYFKN